MRKRWRRGDSGKQDRSKQGADRGHGRLGSI